ncbi:Uncharacterized protein HZ326_26790 [Fusarium oxysporum f. sp. albedinis]|nr:Uncharacterized protein HZ326_26790 [Fusarium oxysporum f. sp. albedinis]
MNRLFAFATLSGPLRSYCTSSGSDGFGVWLNLSPGGWFSAYHLSVVASSRTRQSLSSCRPPWLSRMPE